MLVQSRIGTDSHRGEWFAVEAPGLDHELHLGGGLNGRVMKRILVVLATEAGRGQVRYVQRDRRSACTRAGLAVLHGTTGRVGWGAEERLR